MCGFAGFAGLGSRNDLERMNEALVHRGPDGKGSYHDPDASVYLAHRRLAVIDLTAGEQPMWNEDGQVGVIYNGEIYNHADLRVELEARGHRFSSDHCDTEVLVHGYEEWGDALPERLNGMFAFAIYDRRRRHIFLARDRFGEKPLYYTAQPSLIAFASELSALIKHGSVGSSISPRALQKLFAWGYLPAPNAFVDGVHKLPGGHWLRYDLSDGTVCKQAYWTFSLEPDHALSDEDEPRLVDELEGLLVEAARRRLMSDVPLGVFLSGGLDSSSVLGAVARSRPAGSIDTFTIGFTEASYDESAYARTVAEQIGTRHHERRLDMVQARDLIPSVLGRLDEPLGDPSIVPTHMLSMFAREHVTVALSGDGGDELFAGYDPFAALGPGRTYSRLMPSFAHQSLRQLVELMPRSDRNMSLDYKLRRTLLGLSYPPSYWLPVWMAPLAPAEMVDFLSEPLPMEVVYEEALNLWETGRHKSDVERALEFFTTFYLQDNILMKVDRASMMTSLETRAVFLDNDLVDFCRRLPTRFKYRNGVRKYLLKQVARRFLPDDIVDRKKKGFGIPAGKWLKDVPAVPPLNPLPGVHGNFAKRAFSEHRSGRRDHRLFLWNWLACQASIGNLDQEV